MATSNDVPTFDIPGMGRITAAEFAVAYNRGEVPADFIKLEDGAMLEALPDGSGVMQKANLRMIEVTVSYGGAISALPKVSPFTGGECSAVVVGILDDVPSVSTPEAAREAFGPEVRYEDGSAASLTAAVIDLIDGSRPVRAIKVGE